MSGVQNFPGGDTASKGQRTASFSEVETAGLRTGKVHVVPVEKNMIATGGLAEAIYRGLEVLLALVGLTVGMPIMLATAALVRLDSPGPVLFLHRRPARSICVRGRELEGRADLWPPPGGYDPEAFYYVPSYFTLIKFRTMYWDARTRFPRYYDYKYTLQDFHQQYPTIQNDPRITRIGRILRKLSVDELPNLWSVVTGDLRLVGPRPEAPEVLPYYTPAEMYKFACKPGITGLAQVSGRGLLNWGETLALDLVYVRTRSIALDVKIIFLTVKKVLARHGAF